MTRKPTAPAAETSPDVAAADLETLREEAAACRACPLWKDATQTVFGEGPDHAPLMLVGEQPGDKEDLAGHPFVGPAGQMLDRALQEAGIIGIAPLRAVPRLSMVGIFPTAQTVAAQIAMIAALAAGFALNRRRT